MASIKTNHITQERLKSIVSYDPDTGIFRANGPYFELNRNRIIPGRQAGTIIGCQKSKDGYLVARFDGLLYRLHRLAFLYMNGSIPKVVDHIDGNPSNNKWSNLRASSQMQNTQNQKSKKINKLGLKGVCWVPDRNKFKASITFNYRHIHLGYFKTKEEARNCYIAAAKERFGDFYADRN